MSVEDLLFCKPSTFQISGLVFKTQLNSMIAISKGQLPSDFYTQSLILRFLPFERKLLLELFQNALPAETRKDAESPGPIDNVWCRIFYRWSWASAVLRQILAELDPQQLEVEHEGDQGRAWETCLKGLRTINTRVLSDRRYYRTQQLVRDNEAFTAKIGTLNQIQIAVQPAEADQPLWRMLAFVFVENIEAMRDWNGFGCLSKSFETSGFAMKPKDARLPVIEDDVVPTERIKELVISDIVNGQEVKVAIPMLSSALTRRWTPQDKGKDQEHISSPANIDPTTEAATNVLVDVNDVWDVWSFGRLYSLQCKGVEKDRSDFHWNELLESKCFSDHWEEKSFTRSDEKQDILGYFPKRVQVQNTVSVHQY
jgi:hypothetical protein